jgi:hypothetical protein
MKKYLVIVLLIVPCLALSSLDIGFGANVSGLVDTEKQDTSSASLIQMQLIPSLVLMLTPQVEIHPFIAIGYSKESDPDSFVVDIEDDLSQLWFAGGCGLFYHFINREIVSVSMGPRLALFYYLKPTGTSADVYDSYLNLSVNVGLPIYLDVKLKSWLVLRTGVELYGVRLSIYKEEVGGVTSSSTDFGIEDYFLGDLGYLQAYVGFNFML